MRSFAILFGYSSIAKRLKTALARNFQAIEMEGAAVAQVCEELGVPYIVVQAISDQADQEASIDFLKFSPYAHGPKKLVRTTHD